MWVKKQKQASVGNYCKRVIDLFTIEKIILVIVMILGFVIGTYTNKVFNDQKYISEFAAKEAIKKDKEFAAFLKKLGFKINNLYLDIKFKDLQKLEYKKEVTLSPSRFGGLPVLFSFDDDYVNAKIKYKKKKYKSEIRLKGDLSVHLHNEKKSLRVKIKKNKALLGMRNFFLQSPSTRNYFYQWIYLNLLKAEDLIGLRYNFANVILNGKDLGLFAIEEHFSKELIEHNELREGPILKLDETPLWKDIWIQGLNTGQISLKNNFKKQLSAEVLPFKKGKVLSDPKQLDYFNKAHILLNKFRSGSLPAEEVFDLKKFSKFIAITELCGGQHALYWNNIRFYYNPVTLKIEPIGFDADAGHEIDLEDLLYIPEQSKLEGSFYYYLFRSSSFIDAYVKALEKITKENYFRSSLEKITKDLNASALEKEGAFFDENLFERNRLILVDRLKEYK